MRCSLSHGLLGLLGLLALTGLVTAGAACSGSDAGVPPPDFAADTNEGGVATPVGSTEPGPGPGTLNDGAAPPPVVDAAADTTTAPFVPSPPVDVGFGATYEHVGSGSAVLIVYGGYSAELAWSQAWGAELVRARLAASGVGHLYSAQGPKEPGYDSREIGNSGLRAHIGQGIASAAPFILVAAHSSGSYVAHEILQQWDTQNDTQTLGKIVYANLDGGGSGLDDALVSKLRRIAFVYGKDPTLASASSANASTAIALGSQYSAYGSSLEMSVSNSGCHSGAKWCLHDLLITHRPHDPDNYDLAQDYTDFVGRPVTSEYVDDLATYLQ